MQLSDEVLRSAVVPAGRHTLEMSFEPKSYERGEAVSRACSILLILLALGAAAGPLACQVRSSACRAKPSK